MIDATRRWGPAGLAFLALFCALAYIKMPVSFAGGRLWAEEGTIFLPDLLHAQFVGALSYEYKGTIQVLTSISIWFAAKFPLTAIPQVTTLAGLAVAFIVAAQAWCFAGSVGVARLTQAVFFAAWFFLPESFETWASATNMQWPCSLSMLFVLLTEAATLQRWRRLLFPWVVLCGLTGVPSSMLAPAFLLRGVWSRSRLVLAVGGVLTLTAVVELCAIATSGTQGRPFAFPIFAIVTALSSHTILLPLAGAQQTREFLRLHTSTPPDLKSALYMVLPLALVLGFAVYATKGSRRFWQLVATVCCWVGVTVLNCFGSLEGPSDLVRPLEASRYFYLGATCCCVTLLLSVAAARRASSRVVGLLALCITLGWGLQSRFLTTDNDWCLTGPSWTKQLAQCRTAVCDVQLWPQSPRWRVRVSRDPLSIAPLSE